MRKKIPYHIMAPFFVLAYYNCFPQYFLLAEGNGLHLTLYKVRANHNCVVLRLPRPSRQYSSNADVLWCLLTSRLTNAQIGRVLVVYAIIANLESTVGLKLYLQTLAYRIVWITR